MYDNDNTRNVLSWSAMNRYTCTCRCKATISVALEFEL